jgi:hypothetical protein
VRWRIVAFTIPPEGGEVGRPRVVGPDEREHELEPGRVAERVAPALAEPLVDPVEDPLGGGVAAREPEELAAEGDLLADERVVAAAPRVERDGLPSDREGAQGVPVVVGPLGLAEQVGVAGVLGVDPVVARRLADEPPEVELARVEVGGGPAAGDGVGDRARAVRDHPLGTVAGGVDLVEEVDPRAPGLVGGEADPPGHHRLPGVVAADRDEHRAAPLVGVPSRVEVVCAVGTQVERLGVEDQDPGAPRRRELLVDRRAEQVEVAGGERVLAAGVPHPMGVLP